MVVIRNYSSGGSDRGDCINTLLKLLLLLLVMMMRIIRKIKMMVKYVCVRKYKHGYVYGRQLSCSSKV